MDITKLQQEIKTTEESLNRMKEQLKEAEQMNSKDYYPEDRIFEFNPENTLKVVDGNHSDLSLAFCWEKTPQGHDYWFQKRNNKSPITDEDKITLLRWCVNYYKAQTK